MNLPHFFVFDPGDCIARGRGPGIIFRLYIVVLRIRAVLSLIDNSIFLLFCAIVKKTKG